MFIEKETLAQAFSCEFCETFKNTLFTQNASSGCFCNDQCTLTYKNHSIDQQSMVKDLRIKQRNNLTYSVFILINYIMSVGQMTARLIDKVNSG